MESTLKDRAAIVADKGIFLGGPIDIFESAGRKTFMLMIEQGLLPSTKVLDIGCGCLRNGYWLIHFLETGNYFGIEPNTAMLRAGKEIIVGQPTIAAKKPQFDANDRFDFSVFSASFDMYLARSIWTHASKPQIVSMLDSFVATAAVDARFLTSYHQAFKPESEYLGEDWVGLSHRSSTPGMIAHSIGWIREQCALRGLRATQIEDEKYAFANQYWLSIERIEL